MRVILCLIAFLASGLAEQRDMENYRVTPALYARIKGDLMRMLQQFNTTDPKTGKFKYIVMPTVVRFGFHSCVGGCDGCINLNDANNYGLQRAISPLETVYSYYKANVTRADFWAFALNIASEFACKTPGGSNYVPAFTAEYGRVDCPTAPGTANLYEYPNPNMDTATLTDYYYRTMGLSPQEVVALLGAHTLGGGHRKDSGYYNDWDDQPNKLDNGFFEDMMNPAFGWRMSSDKTDLYDKDQYQWVHSDNTYFMLDADMALYKNIAPVTKNGYVQCAWKDCPLSTTASVVELYAKNNQKFLDDYAAVIAKMLRTGQGPLKPVHG